MGGIDGVEKGATALVQRVEGSVFAASSGEEQHKWAAIVNGSKKGP